MKAKSSPFLVWVDLEMTGLSAEEDVILEMAMILTDPQLKPLAPPFQAEIWQPEAALGGMIPFVQQMHDKTGLIARVRAAKLGLADVERQAVELLLRHVPYRRGLLAGNSIHHDRTFLARYMPHFEHLLHYRQLDVSSIKEAVKMWGGKTFEKPSENHHTALGDIEQSIAELAFYRQTACVPPLRGPGPA